MYRFIECRHVMPTGRKCHSPALRGKPFCYYNAKLHFRSFATRRPGVPVDSRLEDLGGIRTAAAKVLEALTSPSVDTRRAGLLLYGLQLAASLSKRSSTPEEWGQTEAPSN